MSRLARERVVVALSGEGADEVFGGYSWYHLVARRERFMRLPGMLALAPRLPPTGAPGRLRRLVGRDVALAANAFVDPLTAAGLTGGAPSDLLDGRRAMWPDGPGRANDLFTYDQRTYLQHALQRQDRMSMAAAVEAREPFLDHPLVEWANGLGVSARLPGGVTKGLLKGVAADWLPADIINRPKNGFGVPFGEWMRRGQPMWERLCAVTDPGGPLAGWVDGPRLRRLVDEHGTGAADHRSVLWSLLALDAWARVFLGPEPLAATLPGSRP
jgi:asparagine synthase (glutamine-hydrolysing)